jgi:DNA replication protein DnaD
MEKDELNIFDSYFVVRNGIFHTKQSQLNSERVRFIRENYSRKQYLKEIASVTMHFGRQTGASFWIIQKSLELSADGKKISIITHNNSITNYMKREMSKYDTSCEEKENNINYFVSESNNGIEKAVSNYADYIFVDITPLTSKSKLDLLYTHPDVEMIVFC